MTEDKTFIVKNNNSKYIIVIPQSCAEFIEDSAKDFSELLEKATGAKFAIKTDAEIENWNENCEIFSFGFTTCLKQAGVAHATLNLGGSGFLIKTVGKSVFVTGATEHAYGTMCGVYELLNQLIDFEPFGVDCIHYNHVDDLLLKEFDMVDVPDIEYRLDPVCEIYGYRAKNRQRFISFEELVVDVPNYGWGHNSLGYAEPKTYREEHPEWYNAAGTQLSLTASGNEESRKQLMNVIFNSIVQFLSDNPSKKHIVIAHQDSPQLSPHDREYAIKKYGCLSGLWIEVCNELQTRLTEYYAEHNIQREVKILFYAYVITQDPPVKRNKHGEYEPTIKAVKNVGCVFCPIHMHQGEPLNHEKNKVDKLRLENWKLVSDDVWLWVYNACYYDYIYPRYGFDAVAGSIRFAKELGVPTYFEQGQTGNHRAYNFGELQNYLKCKLGWNTKLDENILIDVWFEHYFDIAQAPMRAYFEALKENYRKVTQENDLIMRCDMMEYKNYKCMPKDLIDKGLGLIQQALIAIEYYKDSDPEKYEHLYKRIVTERFSLLYAIMYTYKFDYSEAYVTAIRKRIKEDGDFIGVTNWREGFDRNIQDLWDEWNV